MFLQVLCPKSSALGCGASFPWGHPTGTCPRGAATYSAAGAASFFLTPGKEVQHVSSLPLRHSLPLAGVLAAAGTNKPSGNCNSFWKDKHYLLPFSPYTNTAVHTTTHQPLSSLLYFLCLAIQSLEITSNGWHPCLWQWVELDDL